MQGGREPDRVRGARSSQPLGGLKVEGNLVEEGFFVREPAKIPYVYGLTCGELAEMINGEGMLDTPATSLWSK